MQYLLTACYRHCCHHILLLEPEGLLHPFSFQIPAVGEERIATFSRAPSPLLSIRALVIPTLYPHYYGLWKHVQWTLFKVSALVPGNREASVPCHECRSLYQAGPNAVNPTHFILSLNMGTIIFIQCWSLSHSPWLFLKQQLTASSLLCCMVSHCITGLQIPLQFLIKNTLLVMFCSNCDDTLPISSTCLQFALLLQPVIFFDPGLRVSQLKASFFSLPFQLSSSFSSFFSLRIHLLVTTWVCSL